MISCIEGQKEAHVLRWSSRISLMLMMSRMIPISAMRMGFIIYLKDTGKYLLISVWVVFNLILLR